MKHSQYNRETREFTLTEIGEFSPVKWVSVTNGQIVYLSCKLNDAGEMGVCGPFTVKDVSHRKLTNVKGRTFMHYPEELMVKEDEK